eukprot:scaffold7698_cov186-Alexandrium_tamarense.AAC.4
MSLWVIDKVTSAPNFAVLSFMALARIVECVKGRSSPYIAIYYSICECKDQTHRAATTTTMNCLVGGDTIMYLLGRSLLMLVQLEIELLTDCNLQKSLFASASCSPEFKTSWPRMAPSERHRQSTIGQQHVLELNRPLTTSLCPAPASTPASVSSLPL